MRVFSLGLMALVLLASCQPPTAPEKPVPQSMAVTGTSPTDPPYAWDFSPLTNVSKTRQVSLDLPAGRVYYLLTNVSASPGANASLAGVASVNRSSSEGPSRAAVPGGRRIADPSERILAPDRPQRTPASRSIGPAPLLSHTQGASTTFIDAFWASSSSPKAANKHPSTLRKQVTAHGRTLNIWVADDCWDEDGGNPKTTPGTPDATKPTGNTTAWNPPNHMITQAMLDAFAPKFLANGVNNDIYEWDTAVFGDEWSPSAAPPVYQYAGRNYTMIDGQGEIHIFLANLNPGGVANGVLMGYFHALNNFRAVDGATGSNEKILFALDADSLANPDDDGDSGNPDAGVWTLADYWPAEIVSTLAHEFQHMIHFYQKQVRNNVTAETATWINEMCSLLAEDLLSDKMQVPGPRGVLGTDYSVGAVQNNANGRLPLFAYFHEMLSLTGWGQGLVPANNGGTSVLHSYANAYAFGAWLMRNYGGPDLLRDLVQSPGTGPQAVVDAVNAHGGNGATFASLVRDWGLATFLESSSLAGLAYRSTVYPNPFEWVDGTTTYDVGSIDLGQYRVDPAVPAGPWVFSYADYLGEFYTFNRVAPGATSFHDLGVQTAGTRTVTLPPNVVLTVVVEP